MLVRLTIALLILSPPHAQPPEWSQEVRDVFFDDAREQLVGQRPDDRPLSVPAPSETKSEPVSPWSQLIEVETLRAEIKRLNNVLAGSVRSPSHFKSGGFRDCRRVFAELAVLFAVIAEYGGEHPVRWQKESLGLRNAFSRAARNCKVATDPTFVEARRRHEDLNALLRGQSVQLAKQTEEMEEEVAWDKIAERSQLMLRMELAVQEQLASSLGSESSFRKKNQQLRHEAQVLAMLAEVIQQKGYEYADDDTYLEYVQQFREASQQLDRACKQNDYRSARKAVGRVTQSCSDCHEDYRG